MWYKIPVHIYQKMIKNVVTKEYKISSQKEVDKVNQESLHLVKTNEPGLETRVEVFSQGEAFISIKDHKPSFPSKIDVRLLNSAKAQLGKISKMKLQEMNSAIRNKTRLNQLQSTNDAISWFNSLKWKNRRYSGGRLRCYGRYSVRRFGYFNHLSNRILKQMIHHWKALI